MKWMGEMNAGLSGRALSAAHMSCHMHALHGVHVYKVKTKEPVFGTPVECLDRRMGPLLCHRDNPGLRRALGPPQ